MKQVWLSLSAGVWIWLVVLQKVAGWLAKSYESLCKHTVRNERKWGSHALFVCAWSVHFVMAEFQRYCKSVWGFAFVCQFWDLSVWWGWFEWARDHRLIDMREPEGIQTVMAMGHSQLKGLLLLLTKLDAIDSSLGYSADSYGCKPFLSEGQCATPVVLWVFTASAATFRDSRARYWHSAPRHEVRKSLKQ